MQLSVLPLPPKADLAVMACNATQLFWRWVLAQLSQPTATGHVSQPLLPNLAGEVVILNEVCP